MNIRELLSGSLLELLEVDYSCGKKYTDKAMSEASRTFAIVGGQYGRLRRRLLLTYLKNSNAEERSADCQLGAEDDQEEVNAQRSEAVGACSIHEDI